MENFTIMTDSSCDLTQGFADELGLKVVPLTLLLDGQEYANYLDGRDISFSDFYARLRAGQTATTSAVSLGLFLQEMEALLAAGQDVLYLGFSTGLSVTCNNAYLAAAELAEKYPQRKLYVVDTLCASLGQGLLVYLAALERQKGRGIDQVRDFVEENKLHLCHWFTVDDLNHLKRGGRVSATSAMVGTMLSIKPVMHMDEAGHLAPVSKARGRKAALRELVRQMEETAIDPQQQVVFISHGDCQEEADYLADLVREHTGASDVRINYVGPVIGAHSGPGTLALFFLGSKR